MRSKVWLVAILSVGLLVTMMGQGLAMPLTVATDGLRSVEAGHQPDSVTPGQPIYLWVRSPFPIRSAEVTYQDLSYWDDGQGGLREGQIHSQKATFIQRNLASFTVPKHHVVVPGLRYSWTIETHDGQRITTQESKVYVVDLEAMRADYAEDAVGMQTVGNLGYDIQYFSGSLPGGAGTVTFGSAVMPHTQTASAAPVTSKLLEPRSTGTTIHIGVDFGILNKPVRAMQGGVIRFVGDLGKGAGLTVEIDHGGYFSRYLHLSQFANGITAGKSVSKGAEIGTSGSSGEVDPHLHVEWFVFVNGNTRRVLYPFRWFVGNVSGYNNGQDFDFVQQPVHGFSSTLGTYVDVNIYPKGTRDGSAVSAYINWRRKGTTSWTRSQMSSVGGNVYRYYFDPSLDGQVIQFWIEARRGSISQWVTRPVENNSSAPSNYYEVAVRKGTIQSIPEDEEE